MVSRSLLAIFAVVLVVASVNAAPAQEVDDFELDDVVERGAIKEWFSKIAEAGADKLIDKAKDYIIQKAEKFNFACIKETYDYCQISPMKHPKKFYDCAKIYLKEHKEHCFPEKN